MQMRIPNSYTYDFHSPIKTRYDFSVMSIYASSFLRIQFACNSAVTASSLHCGPIRPIKMPQHQWEIYVVQNLTYTIKDQLLNSIYKSCDFPVRYAYNKKHLVLILDFSSHIICSAANHNG